MTTTATSMSMSHAMPSRATIGLRRPANLAIRPGHVLPVPCIPLMCLEHACDPAVPANPAREYTPFPGANKCAGVPAPVTRVEYGRLFTWTPKAHAFY